jgi:hypothetical protein
MSDPSVMANARWVAEMCAMAFLEKWMLVMVSKTIMIEAGKSHIRWGYGIRRRGESGMERGHKVSVRHLTS